MTEAMPSSSSAGITDCPGHSSHSASASTQPSGSTIPTLAPPPPVSRSGSEVKLDQKEGRLAGGDVGSGLGSGSPFDIDDEEGWQDMPVVRSGDPFSPLDPSSSDESDSDPQHREAGPSKARSRPAGKRRKPHYTAPQRIFDLEDEKAATNGVASAAHAKTGNATGQALELDPELREYAEGSNWRQKAQTDESDYTRLRLNEDEESEEVHMRTRYLFDEDKAMTPMSQMQATKQLLTEGQRIAYVGLCALVAREMIIDMGRGLVSSKPKGLFSRSESVGERKDPEVVAAGKIWMMKTMARLYQHMDLDTAEQKMIESLAEHGVTAMDLVPALMTTHTIKNPEYDPKEALRHEVIHEEEGEETNRPKSGLLSPPTQTKKPELRNRLRSTDRPINPFGDDEDEEVEESAVQMKPSPEEDGGDLAAVTTHLDAVDLSRQKTRRASEPAEVTRQSEGAPEQSRALPGVSTTLSKTEENLTLDIRWTILIADSVYDSRSRNFLERVAGKLGVTWLDVTRFEKRVTDALEIQEGVEQLEQDEIIDGRIKRGKRRRYAMMGIATLGGGLVIGLSAGLLAPVIGAGLGLALGTVGVTGGTTFLAGAGGAAVITTTGIVTGSAIGGKGMAKRTRHVRTFEFRPIHNNKRVNCFITVPGYMASTVDDVRLPFSTLDPIVGDVFAVHWEPEMMNEMGNALSILTNEVLTQVGQQVLAATIMTGLMSALQLPMLLTKLGYLIDNPWSNALDRAYAAGMVLADTLISRHAGVRPISLIGFSLGARVVFYALEELSRQKAFGIVDEVYLFGATVSASRETWMAARSVVAGRFVNAFATDDWVLAYLFRAASGGGVVAGLRPVENVPGLDNIDITGMVPSHVAYRAAMPALLERVGLPITADWFDEPDDPELDPTVQERIIVREEEEAAKRKKKTWNPFTRKKSAGRIPSASSSTTQLPPSYESDKQAYDDGGTTSSNELSSATSTARPSQDSSDGLPSKTAGFDFKAISKVLGKDVDPSHVKLDHPKAGPATSNRANTDPVMQPIVPAAPTIERSESAPPATMADAGNQVVKAETVDGTAIVAPPGMTRNSSTSWLPTTATSGGSKGIPPPRPFPSHILASAASIVQANSAKEDRRPASELDSASYLNSNSERPRYSDFRQKSSTFGYSDEDEDDLAGSSAFDDDLNRDSQEKGKGLFAGSFSSSQENDRELGTYSSQKTSHTTDWTMENPW